MPRFLLFERFIHSRCTYLSAMVIHFMPKSNTRGKKPHFQWNQLYFSLIKSFISNRFKCYLFTCGFCNDYIIHLRCKVPKHLSAALGAIQNKWSCQSLNLSGFHSLSNIKIEYTIKQLKNNSEKNHLLCLFYLQSNSPVQKLVQSIF